MSQAANLLNLIDTMITEATQKGLLHLTADSDALDGRIIHLDGRPFINFGVCSYLGLEMDPRLKQGTIDAVLRYGTQFASSRGYLSAPPYSELEFLLQRMVDAPVLVTPTTTLGHLAAIPTLIGEEDAVLMDQQVHHSVQMAVEHVRAIGTSVEVLRHNDMQALNKRLSELSAHYQRIWYLADGVYSMFGDVVPLEELKHLLQRYTNLHLYLDDAHGMSWTGTHGRGYVLSHLPERNRVVVALSMAKGFAAGGGVLVFPDTETLRRVRSCGGPMRSPSPFTALTGRRDALVRNGHAPSAQTALLLPCLRTAKSGESHSPCLSRSTSRGDPACLSRTQQSVGPHAHLWCLSHHRLQLDQKKVAQLPPLQSTLLAPDPEDPASTTLELDELWSFVLKKAHDSWIWIALCRKSRQVVAYAVGDRSLPDVPAVVGGHSRGISTGALLHGFLGGLRGGDSRGTTRALWARETGETAHVERWNNILRQRLARFVRMTLSFSKSVLMHEACLLLFLHRYNTERAILLK